mmetsp:Transcript_35655/g.81735  ORF Transcript_35655/g.81735 Transcript_35655/m.81735 type:complete len:329 (-) Transcript_35655:98-1084(-)
MAVAKPFDYSKWDRIEDSDDEEKHHPNLDQGLNRRVIRITRDRKEEEIDEKQKELVEAGKLREAEKLEKKRPLHLGNLGKVTEDRTIIKSFDGSTVDRNRRDDDFCVDEYSDFKHKNKKLLDAFTEASWEQSREMLMVEGAILMDGYANNYYMLTTLEEEMKGNKERVAKLGRQGQIISQIHQLAEPMKRPARDLIPRFFEKFERPESRAAFQEGVDHFLRQIAKRAEQKKEEEKLAEEEEARKAAELENAQPVSLVEAMYQMSEEERKGPGGLDPVEVFESLPEKLQECFRSGDIEMLKQAAQEMPSTEFENHFQRCIDSGLWTSGA